MILLSFIDSRFMTNRSNDVSMPRPYYPSDRYRAISLEEYSLNEYKVLHFPNKIDFANKNNLHKRFLFFYMSHVYNTFPSRRVGKLLYNIEYKQYQTGYKQNQNQEYFFLHFILKRFIPDATILARKQKSFQPVLFLLMW